MSKIDFTSPREAARAFTPKLTGFVEEPLYSKVWPDADLVPRDRSLVTAATLIAGGHAEELPAHLRRAVENGVTKRELSGLITHMAFYVGFPAAITASAIANATLGAIEESK
ncbi:4-carboxymuconolactone decarboxylase [Luteibacter jiangsuensis]|uniref:4-carboxymuconolactone decarboxylase n=1 Tax=Luteibacter jiangsuensis TaxID=637577 RepID=A0ABT9T5B6_9GAMM|nr:carboxymuconolactone decarboxylase family protein [Luteibacter jiangsuensis]MDQ0011362.1 4-carboxymuconolactone decarboxylase [Luteibacter jiangsuensis]